MSKCLQYYLVKLWFGDIEEKAFQSSYGPMLKNVQEWQLHVELFLSQEAGTPAKCNFFGISFQNHHWHCDLIHLRVLQNVSYCYHSHYVLYIVSYYAI